MVRSSTPNPNPNPSLGTRSMCMTRRSASVHLWNGISKKPVSIRDQNVCRLGMPMPCAPGMHAFLAGAQYNTTPFENSTCTVLPYSCGSKCQLVYACLVRGYGNVYWKGVSKHEKALTRVDLFMGSKQQVAPTGEPPLRAPRLTTAGKMSGRQAPRGAAARLRFLCAEPMRSGRIGSDGSAEHARRRPLERGLLLGASMAATVSIHRAAYYWFHSRRRSKARSIASQFPMPAPSLASASSTKPAETTRDALWAGQWSTESKRDLILLL
jgi:hypothetical protein